MWGLCKCEHVSHLSLQLAMLNTPAIPPTTRYRGSICMLLIGNFISKGAVVLYGGLEGSLEFYRERMQLHLYYR